LEVAFDKELSKQLEELSTYELTEVLAVITDRICTIIQERCDEDEYLLDNSDLH